MLGTVDACLITIGDNDDVHAGKESREFGGELSSVQPARQVS
jgi:hypothetical protein